MFVLNRFILKNLHNANEYRNYDCIHVICRKKKEYSYSHKESCAFHILLVWKDYERSSTAF